MNKKDSCDEMVEKKKKIGMEKKNCLEHIAKNTAIFSYSVTRTK